MEPWKIVYNLQKECGLARLKQLRRILQMPNAKAGNTPADGTIQTGFVKFLDAAGNPPQVGRDATYTWPMPTVEADGTVMPGEWTVKEDNPVICRRGWHVATLAGVTEWLNERAFSANIAGVVRDDGNAEHATKVCANQGQLVYEYKNWNTPEGKQAVLLALLDAIRPGLERVKNEVAAYDIGTFDAFVDAYRAYAANGPAGGVDAVLDASSAARTALGAVRQNERKAITMLPGYVSNMVYAISSTALSVGAVRNAMNYFTNAYECVLHQDATNAHTRYNPTAGFTAARIKAGEVFVASVGGEAPAMSPQYAKIVAVRTVATAAKNAQAADKSVADAQAAVEKAQAALAAAQAAVPAAQEKATAAHAAVRTAHAALLEAHEGNQAAVTQTLLSLIK